jgi:hypothetical protein
MKFAPTITISLALLAAFLIKVISEKLLVVKTPSTSFPSIAGRKELPPVASKSLSYDYINNYLRLMSHS